MRQIMLNGAVMKGVSFSLMVSALLLSQPATAGGFLGDIINQVAPGVGTSLDQLNAQLGNPVDHAAAAALDVYVPGAGTALEAGWALQNSGALSRPPPQHQQQGWSQQGGGSGFRPMTPPPFIPNVPSQAIGWQQQSQALPQVGNRCATAAGVFGPGPIAQLGAQCYANTAYGPLIGYVVR